MAYDKKEKSAGKSKGYKDPMMMKDPWVMDVSSSVFQKSNPNKMGEEILAAPGHKRPTAHVKINECDH